MGLWDSFSDRISTIYLPDRKRPMLPTVLSDALCSLQEGRWRFALALNIYIDEDGKIYDTEYTNTCIKVKKIMYTMNLICYRLKIINYYTKK